MNFLPAQTNLNGCFIQKMFINLKFFSGLKYVNLLSFSEQIRCQNLHILA